MALPLPDLGWCPAISARVISVSEEWVVAVTPMIYNDRVLLCAAHEWDTSITAGWCYDKGGAAFIAAAVWDPAVDAEPAGYKKCAFDARRMRLVREAETP